MSGKLQYEEPPKDLTLEQLVLWHFHRAQKSVAMIHIVYEVENNGEPCIQGMLVSLPLKASMPEEFVQAIRRKLCREWGLIPLEALLNVE